MIQIGQTLFHLNNQKKKKKTWETFSQLHRPLSSAYSFSKYIPRKMHLNKTFLSPRHTFNQTLKLVPVPIHYSYEMYKSKSL